MLFNSSSLLKITAYLLSVATINVVLSTFFNVAIWLSLPFLLPRGPEVQGRRRERLRKFSLCKLHAGDPGDGGREKRELTDRDSRASLLETRLIPSGLHRPDHWAGNHESSLRHPRPHEHVLVLTAPQSLTQGSSHHAGGHSTEKEIFYLILPSPYQFNTLVFLSFSKSLNFIQDPNDKLPNVTDPTLFLAFQVRKLRVIFNSSLSLMCISNLLS